MSWADRYDRLAQEIRYPGIRQTGGAPDIRELVRHAVLAASSHNTQPWIFHIRKDGIEIEPDFSRRCPVVDPDDSHLFRSLGCATENLVHAAAAQGHAAEIRFDPTRERIVVEWTDHGSAHVTDLYRAIVTRQCARTGYDGSALPSRELDLLEEAARGGGVRAILLTTEARKRTVIEFVGRGNVAQLGDPAFRDELVSWIRFNPGEAIRRGDGLAGRVTGRPALPRWLARWLVPLVLRPASQVRVDAEHIADSAGVAVFVSTGDDRAAWIEAGRAFERFALQATVLGIRTAFVNQPIEVRSLRPQFESWLGLDGEYMQLMVRFGHGPGAAFSLRRPLAEVIVFPDKEGGV